MTSPQQPTQQPVEQGQGLSPAQVAELLALVQAQAAVRAQITRTAIAAAVAIFRALGDWWSADSVGQAAGRVQLILQAAQRQAAQVTDAYLARAVGLLRGRTVSPVGAVDVTALRLALPPDVLKRLAAGDVRQHSIELGDTVDGPSQHIDSPLHLLVPDGVKRTPVPPTDVYGRIADGYRFQVVAQGDTEEKAREKALVRIELAAGTDVTNAVRAQYRKSLAGLKVNGYRRILHPELSETGPCGLCVVAASRIYKTENLLPIHGRCVCEVLPIIGDLDPGVTLNQDDLQRLYEAAGSTGGGKQHGGALKRVRVMLTEHGELGPILVDGGQHFRGPAEVAKATVPDRRTRAAAELAALEKTFERLQHRAAAGEDVSKPLAWQANRIAQLRKVLAEAE